MWDGVNALKSVTTIGFNGIHKENGESLELYYGTAQWAVTTKCARYMVEFFDTHPKFNKRMEHIKFPDEEYFHTVVHNSTFKTKCVKYDEPERRWLVNWRNIHYFEFPGEGVVTFTEKDYDKLVKLEELFVKTRDAAYSIIRAKGSTYYGIAEATRRIVTAIVRDESAILPVSVAPMGAYGLSDISISLPAILGREGVKRVLEMPLSQKEYRMLQDSAAQMRAALESI